MKMFLEKAGLAGLFSLIATTIIILLEFAISGWPRVEFISWSFAIAFWLLWLVNWIMFYGMFSETYTKNWALPKICKNILKGLTLGTPIMPAFWVLVALSYFKENGSWNWTFSPIVLSIPYLFGSWVISAKLGERTNRLSENKIPVN